MEVAGGFFVTGTDTGCGKTEVTLGLMHLLQGMGHSVLGMKPVASGAALTAHGLRNEDASRILRQGSVQADYPLINPFAFAAPVAPHLAAEQEGVAISLPVILDALASLRQLADLVVVEGVGGWNVPLSTRHRVDDLAKKAGLPVILVVGMRLGCINHALLTASAIARSGCKLAGWIANCLDSEMLAMDGNLQTLERRIDGPLLAVLPWMDRPEPGLVAAKLDRGFGECGNLTPSW